MKVVLAFAAVTALLGPCDPTGLKPPKDLAGTWGGDNAGLIADDTSAHVHIGCTYGNVHQQIVPNADGRFDVPGERASTISPRIRSIAGSFIRRGFAVWSVAAT